jgi:hypothetical protein
MQPFTYRALPSGIHELNLNSGTTEAYEECFARLEKIFAETPPDEPLLLLSNVHVFEVGRIPDLWRLSRRLLIKHPRQRRLYNAIVYDASETLSMLLGAMSQLAGIFGARIYFCPLDEQEKATAWLLDQKS